jgi:HlyD family secretion protein
MTRPLSLPKKSGLDDDALVLVSGRTDLPERDPIMKKIIFLLVAIILIVAGGAYFKFNYAADPGTSFRTAAVKRGDVVATISATGTVEPEEVVDIGAQVTGRIESLGPDPRGVESSTSPEKEKYKEKKIDYCTPVRKDDLLAKIDQSVYKAQLDQANANLARSMADLEQMKAKQVQAENDWNRAQSLINTNAISRTDYDLAKANYQAAVANVKVGAAVIKQNQAALDMAEKNFGYTTIVSPVDGVVIQRRVNVGQTVVSSMSASSLFLLASDLRKMEVWALVNEADIGRIHDHPDMPVRFTVDAYPNEVFTGRVEQVRLNAQSTQNVILYTVVVAFENPDLKVLPYMTASLLFDVERHENVLRVSNTALRWKPRLEQVAPELREKLADSLIDKDKEKGNEKDAPPEKKTEAEKSIAKSAKPHDNSGRLWVEDGPYVRPIDVQKGLTDSNVTEVSGPGLKEGMEVVVGEKSPDEDVEGTNPFMPKIFGKKR